MFALLLICFAGLTAEGATPGRDAGPKFGPEFTIARSPDYSSDLNRYRDHLVKHLIENQPEGAKFQRSGDTFTSPEGWSFRFSNDQGVLEIRMNPMTVEDYRKHIFDIQDAIFVSAYNLNLPPQLYTGGGHINIDLAYFKENPLLLRNFLVDFLNHNELAMGILNYDTNNALHPALAPLAESEFLQELEKFDKSELGFAEFVYALKESQRGEDQFKIAWHGSGDRSKHWAMSFHRAVNYGAEERIEVRSVRPQWSAHVWLRQISLLRDRILLLKEVKEPIPYKIRVPLLGISPEQYKLTPPIDPQEALRSFYIYVTESGQSWADHRDYMWPVWMWRQDGEEQSQLEKFEESRWFLVREARNRMRSPFGSCREILEQAAR